MAQILFQAGGKKLDVDHTFTDGGSPPTYAMIGGQRTLLDQGSLPKPTIHCRIVSKGEAAFFFDDGAPIANSEDVAFLPEKWKAMALRFLDRQKGGRGRKVDPTHVRPRKAAGRRKAKFDPTEALGKEALIPARV